MKNQNIDLRAIAKPIASAFKRFHTTLFIVVLVIGLAVAVLVLRTVILNASSGVGADGTAIKADFDSSTMERLKEFHTSKDSLEPVQLPSGRINPFSE